jgi:hypothetical protein
MRPARSAHRRRLDKRAGGRVSIADMGEDAGEGSGAGMARGSDRIAEQLLVHRQSPRNNVGRDNHSFTRCHACRSVTQTRLTD